MNPNEQVYRKLQKHLNNQAVGFPATRSGVELKILKHIFNPDEAEIASYLGYKFEPVETIFGKVKHLTESIEDLQDILDSILKKGGIEVKIKDGKKNYCCSPLVVGMYEFQIERLTPDFIKDFNYYTSTKGFGIDFLSTELPQMRTIPIAKSIHPQHNVSTFDEVMPLLQKAEGPFVIFECICRKKRSIEGQSCKITDRKETCLAIDNLAQMSIANDIGRKISRDEAMSIIEQNQKEGLGEYVDAGSETGSCRLSPRL